MKKISVLLVFIICGFAGVAQKYNIDSSLAALKFEKDSTLKSLKKQRDSAYTAQMHADSVKTDREFKETIKWENLKVISSFPVINAGEMSGVAAVEGITEFPDPKMEYKLLFELTNANPDSNAKKMNFSLVEAIRKINLHAAAGIPVKKIIPVFVIHGDGLWAFTTNEFYQEKFKIDNPNIKIINELQAMGAKFIACGQAMHFIDLEKKSLLPMVKVALTAQTVISTYVLKGYVLYKLW